MTSYGNLWNARRGGLKWWFCCFQNDFRWSQCPCMCFSFLNFFIYLSVKAPSGCSCFVPSQLVCWSVKSAAVGGSGILHSLRFLCLGFVFCQGETHRAPSEWNATLITRLKCRGLRRSGQRLPWCLRVGSVGASGKLLLAQADINDYISTQKRRSRKKKFVNASACLLKCLCLEKRAWIRTIEPL